MVAEKKINKSDVYLTCAELIKKLGVTGNVIYTLYNKRKVRYIFKEIPWCGDFCTIIHFNLDDVRENLQLD